MKGRTWLCAALVLAQTTWVVAAGGSEGAAAADDVSGHWAEADIRKLQDDGVMIGYEDGSFRPSRPIARAEALKAIALAAALEADDKGAEGGPSASAPSFADVPANHWAFSAVEAARDRGLVRGYADGTFRPSEPITRAEAAALFDRAFELSKEGMDVPFPDVPASHWSYAPIGALVANGVASGYPDGAFRPDRPIARAEFAAMTVRAMDATTDGAGAGSPGAVEPSADAHVVDLARWGVRNDGTKPKETTDGLNRALAWAASQGIRKVTLPAGTYTIDKDGHLTLVSNLTLELGGDVVIQKEPNGKESYRTVYIGPGVTNVTLRGGWYRGDRDAHDYSGKDAPWSQGTHENGYGILLEGASNVTIDGVKATHFTGDGLCVCGYGKQIAVLTGADFEAGGIDAAGRPVASGSQIRTKPGKTSLTDPAFAVTRTVHFSLPQGMPRTTKYHLYFYDASGKFLSAANGLELDWSLVEAPAGAASFRAVFDTNRLDGIGVQYWNKPSSTNVVVKRSEFAFNRRQGITVAGANGVVIENNRIHDISGTAPQSGIDIEGGVGGNGHPNRRIVIRGNTFENNARYNVILYDGEDVTVENNDLGPNANRSSIGVAVSSPFRTGAVIRNNVFRGSGIAADNEALFEGNEVRDATASFLGPGITVEDMTFVDSLVRVASTVPFGVSFDRVVIRNGGTAQSGLAVENQPVHLKNVTIEGESALRSLSGNVAQGSIFENLKITNFSRFGLDLPRGTYKNCTFQAADGSSGEAVVARSGLYAFEGCAFETAGRGLVVSHPEAETTVSDSSFDVSGNAEAVFVASAKRVTLEENTIRVNGFTAPWRSAVKINEYGAGQTKADVLAATIVGNTVITNIAAFGISTADAGTGAPPYIVRNNLLQTAKLQLRAADVAEGNVER